MVVARDYKYMCSDPGQELIKQDIRANGLNRVVVASCSPHLHEHTFRRAVAEGGLNPFFFQMVNIREHDSWVHTDKAKATAQGQGPGPGRGAPRRAATSRWSGSACRSTRPCWWSAAASPASTPR